MCTRSAQFQPNNVATPRGGSGQRVPPNQEVLRNSYPPAKGKLVFNVSNSLFNRCGRCTWGDQRTAWRVYFRVLWGILTTLQGGPCPGAVVQYNMNLMAFGCTFCLAIFVLLVFCLFVLNFICVFCVFFLSSVLKEKNHKIRWVERGRTSQRCCGREKHDKSIF